MSAIEIQNMYAAVCEVKPDDVFLAYAELHQCITERSADIGAEALAAMVAQPSSEIAKAAWRSSRLTRHGSSTQGDTTYFRGSGMIVVGGSDGQIHAAQYEHVGEPDPVTGQYGNYLPVAMRKAGLAVAVGRSGIINGNFHAGSRYAIIDDRLCEAGITSGGLGHHLGYAVLNASSGNMLVAGASGMLPSVETDTAIRSLHPEIIKRDKGALYEWDGDAFAGFHDAVAAESVLAQMAKPPVWKAGACIVARTIEDYAGANLH